MTDKAKRDEIRRRWEACHPANGEGDVFMLLDELDEREEMRNQPRRDEILDEWADCGDGYDEGKMAKRLADALDEKDAEIRRLHLYCHHRHTCGLVSSERHQPAGTECTCGLGMP